MALINKSTHKLCLYLYLSRTMNSGKLESHFDIVQMGLDRGAYVYEGAYELQPNSMLMMRGWEWKINEFENEINVVCLL